MLETKTASLFGSIAPSVPAANDEGVGDRQRELDQYLTPYFAAELIVERYFPNLGASDLVLEPTCGAGAFLEAVPSWVPAVGVELDPALAEQARLTGRRIIGGDFRSVPIDFTPTVVIGNPPFKAATFDAILDRVHALLPDEGRAGFVLPAYMLQTPSRVLRYNEQWSMTAEILPRTLWSRLSKPIVFCLFRKGRRRELVGFALFHEAREYEQLRPDYRALLRRASRSVWAEAVVRALASLGGEASLQEIYGAIEGRRPTANVWWKPKIRQQLQRDLFRRVGEQRFALAA